jgi:ATP-dependent DNA ligase
MTMETTKAPRFLFPPHPAPNFKITPEMLPQHEAQQVWLAERKFNGSHCIVWVYKNQVALWNRRGEPFGNYQITQGMKNCILYGLDRNYDTEYVLDGELLHNKAKIKTTNKQAAENVIVFYDILYAGKFLTNLTTTERIDLLYKIAPPNGLENKGRAFKVDENDESQIWVAEVFYDDFSYHFWEMYDFNDKGEDQYPEIEGLVLKMRSAKNTGIGSRPNDVPWMIRCRKPKEKMYMF